jgi:transcriptional regulator with XRE-family HTH domain
MVPDTSGALGGLARRIRALRERRGLRQEDFAARCGISVSFASLLERGERSPSYETLVQMAEALGVPLADLFREDDEAVGAHRLVDFARTHALSRPEVDRLLAVAHVLFAERAAPEPPAARPPECHEPGCDRPVLARELCSAHYHRARRARAKPPP